MLRRVRRGSDFAASIGLTLLVGAATALFTLELGAIPLALGLVALAFIWAAFFGRERDRKRR
jgi:hypothetical protein